MLAVFGNFFKMLLSRSLALLVPILGHSTVIHQPVDVFGSDSLPYGRELLTEAVAKPLSMTVKPSTAEMPTETEDQPKSTQSPNEYQEHQPLCLQEYLPVGLRSRDTYDKIFTPLTDYRVITGVEGYRVILPDETADPTVLASGDVLWLFTWRNIFIDLRARCAVQLKEPFYSVPVLSLPDKLFTVHSVLDGMTFVWRSDSLLPLAVVGHSRPAFDVSHTHLLIGGLTLSLDLNEPAVLVPDNGMSRDISHYPHWPILTYGLRSDSPADGLRIITDETLDVMRSLSRWVDSDLQLADGESQVTQYLGLSLYSRLVDAAELTEDQLSMIRLTKHLRDGKYESAWRLIVELPLQDRSFESITEYLRDVTSRMRRVIARIAQFNLRAGVVYQKLRGMIWRTAPQDKALDLLDLMQQGRLEAALDLDANLTEDMSVDTLERELESMVYDRRRFLWGLLNARVMDD